MSKTKCEKMRRMVEIYDAPEVYRTCGKCGEPIATKMAQWKYKYCAECAFEELDKYRKNNFSGQPPIGGISKIRIKWAFKTGRRWMKDRCEVCGYIESLDVHRIISRNEGGEYTKENTMTLCPNCHTQIHRKGRVLKQEQINGLWSWKIAETAHNTK